MKKSILPFVFLALSLFAYPAFAGGQTEGAGASGSTGIAPEDLKIAVIIPSPPTDGGWGQQGADGLIAASEIYGFEPVIIEAATADLMKREAEALAQEGFNIIFGHGGQYAQPFSEISGSYPDTYFITAGGDVVTDNQMVAEFVAERLAYIQGVMAAKMTDSKKIGGVLGGSYPAYTKTSRAFEMGIKSVDPEIEFLLGVTQNSADMNEGYELTLSQINAGADIVWTNANQASMGSIKAAKDTDSYVFGFVADIQKEALEQVVASTVQDFNSLYTYAIDKFLAGELGGETVVLGIESGGIKWGMERKCREKPLFRCFRPL